MRSLAASSALRLFGSCISTKMLSATLCVLAMAVLWCNGAAYAHGDHEATFFHRQDITHHEVLGDDRAIVEPMPAAAMVLSENATELEKWLMAGDMANYRRLSEIISVSLPLPINLIFIGFDGDGEQGLELVEDNFEEWFEHIDHFVRHRIVPVGEEQTTTEKYKTPKTHVKYFMRYNLVKLDPLVNTIIEDIIYWHMRPEDPHSDTKPGEEVQQKKQDLDKKERFYVDAYKLSRVLYHLLLSLNLTDSYSLFVLNPKSPLSENQVYGYRVGFSDPEINELQRRSGEWSVDLTRFREASELPTQGIHIEPSHDAIMFPKRTEKNTTYTSINLVSRSQEWANWYLEHMVQGGVKLRHLCTQQQSADDPHCLWKSQRSEQKDIVKLATEIAESGSRTQAEYLASIKDFKAQEDCLVDAWIGHARYAWLDLSAGPFKWGPVVAGQGVRSHSTLPRIPNHYALHPEADPATEEDWDHDDEKPKIKPSPKPKQMIASKANAEVHQANLARLQAELQLQQGLWEQKCNPPLESNDLECKVLARSLESARKQLEDGSNNELLSLIMGHENEGEGALLMLDNFLAHLASVISRSIAHVFAPATPLFPAYYTSRITFHFFFIANHRDFKARDFFSSEAFKSEMLKFKLPEQEFSFVFQDLDMSEDKALTMAFAHSMRTSVIPTLSVDGVFSAQTIRYLDSKELQHQLQLLDIHAHADEELEKEKKKAKEGKVRAASSADGDESDENDDEEHFSTSSDKRSGGSQTSRHIPIFIFSLNDDVPVFIDKYYQAKALSNVVLAVQSRHFNWTSRLGCNDKPVRWDLRNPLKATLAATALHYAGLIPMHITYDEPNQCAAQDWLWSVGDNPFSHTSNLHRLTVLQRDIALRNFITNTIEDSISAMNKAIRTLKKLRTTKANFGYADVLPLTELVYSYKAVRRLWDSHAKAFAKLNFDSVRNLHRLVEHTNNFRELVRQVEEYLELAQCGPQTDGEASVVDMILPSDEDGSWWIVPAALVFNLGLTALWILLRKRSRKVKTN